MKISKNTQEALYYMGCTMLIITLVLSLFLGIAYMFVNYTKLTLISYIVFNFIVAFFVVRYYLRKNN